MAQLHGRGRRDTGCFPSRKPLALARTVEIPRAVRNLRFFATAVLHAQSESHTTDHQALNYTLRRPRGVAGLISPWNLPLYLLTWKVAPAIAVGNTAVAKPSELTPATATMLAEASQPLAAHDDHALRSHAGIAPVTRQSGKSRSVLMRRACNPRLRHATYHGGRCAIQRDDLARAHSRALCARGAPHGRAIRGVVDRLLRILCAMLRERTLYDPRRVAPGAPGRLRALLE